MTVDTTWSDICSFGIDGLSTLTQGYLSSGNSHNLLSDDTEPGRGGRYCRGGSETTVVDDEVVHVDDVGKMEMALERAMHWTRE